MLYWFLVASFNGTYSVSANSRIEADLEIIRNAGTSFPLKDLQKAMLQRSPYNNAIRKSEVGGAYGNVLKGRTGMQYLMLLDVVLHRNEATDWAGKRVRSEDAAIHHIFPREFLHDCHEMDNDKINCLANLTLVAPGINSEIGDTPPAEYLKSYVGTDQDIFERHMIPSNPKLWTGDAFDSAT
jgi:hypothetical protein